MDGRFPAQVSVVGEAVEVGGGGKRRKGDAREGRKRVRGPPVGAGAGRSMSQEAASRGAGPYTSVRDGGLSCVGGCLCLRVGPCLRACSVCPRERGGVVSDRLALIAFMEASLLSVSWRTVYLAEGGALS